MPNESGFEESAATELPKSLEQGQEDNHILKFQAIDTARTNVQSSALPMIDHIQDSEDAGAEISLEKKAA